MTILFDEAGREAMRRACSRVLNIEDSDTEMQDPEDVYMNSEKRRFL